VKRVVVTQARMTSTRLPGKVLMDLGGRSVLAEHLRRLKACRRADEIVVATTTGSADDAVVACAAREGVRWFRGSEPDVLARFAGAARATAADLVVRVTADCPLVDPEVVDRVIEEAEAHAGACDYAANVLERTFPRGLDAEAMFRDTLERLARLATSPGAREHVTTFLREERRDLFLVRSIIDSADNSDLSWTVDTAADLARVRALYARLDLAGRIVPYREAIARVRAGAEALRG
jgi:spore coat polysaccharide biosynthesis protein SpsF